MPEKTIGTENTLKTVFNDLTYLMQDYAELLHSFVQSDEKYSSEYRYFNLFASRGELERMLYGLKQALVRSILIEEFQHIWKYVTQEWQERDAMLRSFLRKQVKDDNYYRSPVRSAAIAVESRIREGYVIRSLEYTLTKPPKELDNNLILDAVKTLDNLKLYVEQRSRLGLEGHFGLKPQSGLEGELWKGFAFLQEYRDTVMIFAQDLREQRRRFLIMDKEAYPWWFLDSDFT